MPVIIEAAGDHDFDLAHIRREGGEELLRRLLEKSDLPLQRTWRLQVQKKLNCHAETPPVRVVDEPKKWAIHLKIKPGDNNTCHLCSLLMPDGFSGEQLYYQLGKASAEIDRNWRHKTLESSNATSNGRAAELFPLTPPVAASKPPESTVPAPEIAPPRIAYVPIPPSSAQPEAISPTPEAPASTDSNGTTHAPSGRTRGWLNDPDKIRLILLAIHEINETGDYPQERWSELLGQRMDWTGANRHEVGGVLTGLVRRNLIEKRFRGCRLYGYILSEEGQRQIAELVRATPKAPPPMPAAPTPVPTAPVAPTTAEVPLGLQRNGVNPAEILRSFGPIAQQFLEANTRLEAMAQREEELILELDLIRQEREEICRLLDDNRVQNVLANLARLIQVKG